MRHRLGVDGGPGCQFLQLDRSALEFGGCGLKCFLGELGIGDVLEHPAVGRGEQHAIGAVLALAR